MRMSFRSLLVMLLAALCVAGVASAQDTPVYFSPDPGAAKGEVRLDGFTLSNAAVSMSGRIVGGHVERLDFQNRMVGGNQQVSMLPFALLLGDASVIPATGMKIVAAPKLVALDAQPDAS